jgi:hypothetical protein
LRDIAALTKVRNETAALAIGGPEIRTGENTDENEERLIERVVWRPAPDADADLDKAA